MKKATDFFDSLHLLDSLVIQRDVSGLTAFSEEPFVHRQRLAQSDYAEFQSGLTAQVYSEVKSDIAAQLEGVRRQQQKPMLLRQSKTVKRNNVRFFYQSMRVTPGKYALLMRNLTTKARYFLIADYDGKKWFQVDFTLNPKARDIADSVAGYETFILSTLTPFMRSYQAVKQAPTELVTAVAKGDISKFHRQGELSQLPEEAAALNSSQREALAAFTQLDKGVQVLVGPPGTGKTTTIAMMIHTIRAQFPEQRILICGPSNKSVQVLALAYHTKYPDADMALFANESSFSPAAFHQLEECVVGKQSPRLKTSPVLFMTLSASGNKAIAALKNIDVVIVDEAGQSAESETLIPFQLRPEKVLLVGDPDQLPPTIKTSHAEKWNYNWSMLLRLVQRASQLAFMLNTQYRMHPQISQFPTEAFYQAQLHDGVTAEMRQRGIVDVAPYEVYFHESEERRDKNRSYQNLKEAMCIVRYVKFLLSKGFSTHDIAIITPYSGQVSLLKELLVEHHIAADEMAINTVDSFQGEENAVVLVSMVRANRQARIGFTSNYQRLNVSLTRPREVLRVFLDDATYNPFHAENQWQHDIMKCFLGMRVIPSPEDEGDESLRRVVSGINAFSLFGYRRYLTDYSDTEDYYDLYDLDGYPMDEDLSRSNRVEKIMLDLELLLQRGGRITPKVGRMLLFMLPTFPKRTHLTQDFLNIVKIWQNLDFSGLSDDFFESYRYRMFLYTVDDVEDYGSPYDENGCYASCGYGTGSIETESNELRQTDLVFDGHKFMRCNLSGVNFYNSEFRNTDFSGSCVHDCTVNFDKMDKASRLSFLAALKTSKAAQVAGLLPTRQLIMDAMGRGIYQPAPRNEKSQSVVEISPILSNTLNR